MQLLFRLGGDEGWLCGIEGDWEFSYIVDSKIARVIVLECNHLKGFLIHFLNKSFLDRRLKT